MTEKKVSPGRPKIRPDCKPINLRLSLATIDKLAAIGKQKGENRTQTIERLVRESYDRIERENNEKQPATCRI